MLNIVTNSLFSQPNPTALSSRKTLSLASQIDNLNGIASQLNLALIEGYIREAQTVTYVSTTSFTVLGDQSAVYTKGRAVRFNSDTTGLLTVVSANSIYSTSTQKTTVTVIDPVVTNPLNSVDIALQPKGETNPATVGQILHKPSFFGSIKNAQIVPYAVSLNIDFSDFDAALVTLTGDATIGLTGVSLWQFIIIRAQQDNTGGHALALPGNVTWDNSFVPTLTQTANKADMIGLWARGVDTNGVVNAFDGFVLARDIG